MSCRLSREWAFQPLTDQSPASLINVLFCEENNLGAYLPVFNCNMLLLCVFAFWSAIVFAVRSE